MSLITTLTRMWLTRSVKPFEFKNDYDQTLSFSDCENMGLYVHIPFCKRKCTYCDFASFPSEIGKAEAYFACLYKEIKARSLSLKDKTFSTIYFGGGTPSLLPVEETERLISAIYNIYNVTRARA